MLDRSNTLAKSFRMEKEWFRSHHSQDLSLRLLNERTSSRQYNAPMVFEVIALIINDFGDVVYVIEFQKWGLPHAHILLWLEERFKCTTPDEINNIISTELPSPAEDPDGYKVVSEFMLHGPCGKDAKYAVTTVI
ncbi:hypothetical protein Tco_0827295 [Tanacetum coccineum]